jgi:protein-tyrosine phosphatase
MISTNRWLVLDGAVNVRDAGGLAGDAGPIPPGRLLRSDNLQDLSPRDVALLVDEVGLTDVVDLRSEFEVAVEGPGPLTDHPGVRRHHLSLLPEDGWAQRRPQPGELLPWQTGELAERDRIGGHAAYLGYLSDRPDSVIAALKAVAAADGATVVHCAAGKDRTGVVTALALRIAGVSRADVVADYLLTDERIAAVVDRLAASPTYAQSVAGRALDTMRPQVDTITGVLDALDAGPGGMTGWLTASGFGPDDVSALRAKLAA